MPLTVFQDTLENLASQHEVVVAERDALIAEVERLRAGLAQVTLPCADRCSPIKASDYEPAIVPPRRSAHAAAHAAQLSRLPIDVLVPYRGLGAARRLVAEAAHTAPTPSNHRPSPTFVEPQSEAVVSENQEDADTGSKSMVARISVGSEYFKASVATTRTQRETHVRGFWGTLAALHESLSEDGCLSTNPTNGAIQMNTATTLREALRNTMSAEELLASSVADIRGRRTSVTSIDEGMVLLHNRCFILHPQSMCRLIWDMVGILVICWDIIITPLSLLSDSITEGLPFDVAGVELFVNAFWTVDIFLSFRTGYYQNGKVVMDLSSISKQYTRTWFAFDLLVVIPDWVALLIDRLDSQFSVLRTMRIGRFLRLARVAKLQRLCRDLLCRINSLTVLVALRLLARIGLIIVLAHLLACGWCKLGTIAGGWIEAMDLESTNMGLCYIVAFNWVTAQMHGYSNVYPKSMWERLFASLTSLCCVVLISIFISSTTNMLTGQRYFRSEYHERAVRSFLQRHHIESNIAIRMQKVAADESQLQEQREQDDEVTKLLPLDLLKDLQLQVRGPKLKKGSRIFTLLGDAFPRFFRQMCFEVVSYEYAREGDVIFHADEVCSACRCLADGRLAYSRGAEETENKKEFLTAGAWISELALWTAWKHSGKLEVAVDCWICCLLMADFDRVVQLYKEVHYLLSLYAKQAVLFINTENAACDVLGDLPSWVWTSDYFDNTIRLADADRPVPLPWNDELPDHISGRICVACVQISKMIAADGLDENRPHHGFGIIIGDTKLLESCGKAGFNPFMGHKICIIKADGTMDKEVFDLLRRNAFNADGAIVVEGMTGKVEASGWFVSDISKGGLTGGARSRSAKAIAQQANGCYVIKCSEDSTGELSLHLGEKKMNFNGIVQDIDAMESAA